MVGYNTSNIYIIYVTYIIHNTYIGANPYPGLSNEEYKDSIKSSYNDKVEAGKG